MKRHEFLDDMAKFVGLFVIIVITGGIIMAVVYGLLVERLISLLR